MRPALFVLLFLLGLLPSTVQAAPDVSLRKDGDRQLLFRAHTAPHTELTEAPALLVPAARTQQVLPFGSALLPAMAPTVSIVLYANGETGADDKTATGHPHLRHNYQTHGFF